MNGAPRQTVSILDSEGMRRALTRIAHEIMERNGGAEGLILVGVRTRGVPLAWRIAGLIRQFEGDEVPVREGSFLRFDPDTTRMPVAGPEGMTFIGIGVPRGSYEARGPF